MCLRGNSKCCKTFLEIEAALKRSTTALQPSKLCWHSSADLVSLSDLDVPTITDIIRHMGYKCLNELA
jgi:hypothetical protein